MSASLWKLCLLAEKVGSTKLGVRQSFYLGIATICSDVDRRKRKQSANCEFVSMKSQHAIILLLCVDLVRIDFCGSADR